MTFPITTARLVLRPFTLDDLAAFTAYRNHPEVACYQSWSSYSFDDALKFFDEQKALAFNTDESWFQSKRKPTPTFRCCSVLSTLRAVVGEAVGNGHERVLL